jgi:hypothetical protein
LRRSPTGNTAKAVAPARLTIHCPAQRGTRDPVTAAGVDDRPHFAFGSMNLAPNMTNGFKSAGLRSGKESPAQ